ncbi:unnamed protein product [Dovyalis caffra]|uniref:AAA+ ATPase domain-containing protein n=1 Tax=Dovyalis caffra TaxID=77055 RepID=A0AAV1R0Z3_9ROSI|nr:unnamed protein product [Dovyalis caffra]
MPNTKTVLSVVAASAVLIPSIANLCILSRRFSSQVTLVIEGYEQEYCYEKLFAATETYLGTKLAPSIQRIKASKREREKKPEIAIDIDQEIFYVFENVEVKWRLVLRKKSEFQNILQARLRSYELSFPKEHKEKVLNSYLPFILQQAESIKEDNKLREINCLRGLSWTTYTKIDHPMTFETIVMDERLKEEIIGDLNTFMKSKEYYRKIGKARKRGYLIYGPPGTGKSSLIAAMANLLNYSIHDWDLDAENFPVSEDIRSVLLHRLDKTILVIKDIDSTITVSTGRRGFEQQKEIQKQFGISYRLHAMLLKLLKFIDGLWLPRINELIIVVKTSKKERLDPALLVPGRMDMHIHMPYCTFSTFEQLAVRFLGFYHVELFQEIQGILEGVEVTPAEIVRELSKSTDSLQGVAKFLREKLEKDEQENYKKIESREKLEDHPEGSGEDRLT